MANLESEIRLLDARLLERKVTSGRKASPRAARSPAASSPAASVLSSIQNASGESHGQHASALAVATGVAAGGGLWTKDDMLAQNYEPLKRALQKVGHAAATYDKNRHVMRETAEKYKRGMGMTPHEFALLLRAMDVKLDPRELGSLVRVFDRDGDGFIDGAEFMAEFFRIARETKRDSEERRRREHAQKAARERVRIEQATARRCAKRESKIVFPEQVLGVPARSSGAPPQSPPQPGGPASSYSATGGATTASPAQTMRCAELARPAFVQRRQSIARVLAAERAQAGLSPEAPLPGARSPAPNASAQCASPSPATRSPSRGSPGRRPSMLSPGTVARCVGQEGQEETLALDASALLGAGCIRSLAAPAPAVPSIAAPATVPAATRAAAVERPAPMASSGDPALDRLQQRLSAAQQQSLREAVADVLAAMQRQQAAFGRTVEVSRPLFEAVAANAAPPGHGKPGVSISQFCDGMRQLGFGLSERTVSELAVLLALASSLHGGDGEQLIGCGDLDDALRTVPFLHLLRA